jgi:tetratricopeptide (TPR) repeat protein
MKTFSIQPMNNRVGDANKRELIFKQFSQNHDFDGGIAFYRTIINPQPIDHYYGGAFLVSLSDFEPAEHLLNLALDLGCFQAIPKLSQLYRHTQRPEKAVALLEIFKNSNLPEYTRLIVAYEYGCLLREAGMVGSALKHLAHAWLLVNKPEHSRALVVIGMPYAWTLSHAGQDEQVLEVLKIISEHPHHHPSEMRLQGARSLMRLGRFDEAKSLLSRMEAVSTQDADLALRVETSNILLAIALYETKQADALITQALKLINTYAPVRPETRFYLHLNAVWAAAERWDEAAQARQASQARQVPLLAQEVPPLRQEDAEQTFYDEQFVLARDLAKKLGPRERAYFGYRAGCYVGRCQDDFATAITMLESAAQQFERLAAYREAALCWLNAADMHGRANQWQETPASQRCLQNAEVFLAQTNSYGAMREIHDHTAICRWAFKDEQSIFGQARAKYCEEVKAYFERPPPRPAVPSAVPSAVPPINERDQGRRYLVIMAFGSSSQEPTLNTALAVLRGAPVPAGDRHQMLEHLEQTCQAAIDLALNSNKPTSPLLIAGLAAFCEVAPRRYRVLGGLLLLLQRYQGEQAAQQMLAEMTKHQFMGDGGNDGEGGHLN